MQRQKAEKANNLHYVSQSSIMSTSGFFVTGESSSV